MGQCSLLAVLTLLLFPFSVAGRQLLPENNETALLERVTPLSVDEEDRIWDFSDRESLGSTVEVRFYRQGGFYVNVKGYQGNVIGHRGTSGSLSVQDYGYYPYGLPVSCDENIHTRYLYGEKEFELRQGLNVYDFLARTYAPDECRFWQPDPNSGDYHWLSPYSYCGGDPINYIDPSGMNPVYSRRGELIGVTSSGLVGLPIIVDEEEYSHNPYKDVSEYNDLGVEALEDQEAKNKFTQSVISLMFRPDYDGYITLSEANEWYRNGQGATLYADLSKINLDGVVSLGDEYVGQEKVVNLIVYSGSITDGLVYGNITLVRHPNNTVRAYKDKYDFDMHHGHSPSTLIRNLLTKIGSKVAGNGTPYEIEFYSSKQLKLAPWIKK